MSPHPHHLSDDTSDRLYTPEELASYAAAEGPPDDQPPTSRPDPLSDPLHEVEHTVIRPRPVLPDAPPVTPLRQVTPVAGPPSGPPSSPPSGPPSGPPPQGGPPAVPPSSGPQTGPSKSFWISARSCS